MNRAPRLLPPRISTLAKVWATSMMMLRQTTMKMKASKIRDWVRTLSIFWRP